MPPLKYKQGYFCVIHNLPLFIYTPIIQTNKPFIPYLGGRDDVEVVWFQYQHSLGLELPIRKNF